MEDTTTATITPEATPDAPAPAKITEAQAVQVVVTGVNREVRVDTDRTMSYCKDAVKLRGFKVRELAYKADATGKLQGKPDSYCSNVSNASGIMSLFEDDLEAFAEWLKDSPTKSLKAIFNAFRELFVEKPESEPGDEPADGAGDAGESEPTPLIDVVLSALPHLTAEERVRVAEALIALDTQDDDQADEVAA
jgi:hypothetical protein